MKRQQCQFQKQQAWKFILCHLAKKHQGFRYVHFYKIIAAAAE